MTHKIKTPAKRIDEMLAVYEELNREAYELFDLHVAELVAECPGVPAGVLMQTSITKCAGTMLNIPRALRLLRDRYA
jgi:hypothetical protein